MPAAERGDTLVAAAVCMLKHVAAARSLVTHVLQLCASCMGPTAALGVC